MTDSVEDIQQRLAEFAAERDWDQFHAPKNLVMALVGEVGELVEHFQWLSDADSALLNDDTREDVALEMADVFIYLLRLATKLDIDLIEVANRKTQINEQRYPVDKVRGSARRAEEYE